MKQQAKASRKFPFIYGSINLYLYLIDHPKMSHKLNKIIKWKSLIMRMDTCRIMVNQTMALSGSKQAKNWGYVNLTHNSKVVLDFISKNSRK